MLKALGFLLAGLLLIGGGVAAWFQWEHMFWTALKGPTEVTLAELAKLEDPKQLPSEWIRVKCEKVVEANVVIKRQTDGAVLTKYLLVQVGDRWMIASVKATSGVSVIDGQLYNNNAFENQNAIAAVVSKYPDLRGHIYPFQFHGEVDYRDNGLYIPVLAALIAGLGLTLGCMGIGGISLGLRDPATAQAAARADADRTIDRILHGKGTRG